MSEYVNFNITCDNAEVVGYMNIRSKELEWFSWDGFEAYEDFSRTNMVGETANTEEEFKYLLNWCLIEDFLSKVDIRPQLLKNWNKEAIVTFGNQVDGNKIRLFINCFPYECGEYRIWNEEIEAWGIDPTF